MLKVITAVALAIIALVLLYWLFAPAACLLLLLLAIVGAWFFFFPENFVRTLRTAMEASKAHTTVVKKCAEEAKVAIKANAKTDESDQSSEADETENTDEDETANNKTGKANNTSASTSSDQTGKKGSTNMTANNTKGLRIATICGAEVATDAQIEAQYREAFPDPRERFELADYAPYITEGGTIPFVTRRGKNAVTTSLVEDLGEHGFLLSYLWTNAKDRCKGIGLAHLKSVLAQLDARKPGAVVFIEVEDPEVPNLTDDERTMRTRRLNWYVREFNAQRWSGKYMMPSLRDLSEPGVEGILLAVADRTVSFTEFKKTAIHILTASYEAAQTHPYVKLLKEQRKTSA